MADPNLKCWTAPLDSQRPHKYVVVCSRWQGQWLLSRHRERSTWETQGGHIEPGETPMQAAKRELYEESGAQEADLYPVCDYNGYTDSGSANGVVFLADVHSLGDLPESEMAEARAFAALPEALTYQHVTPVLMREAEKLLPGLNIR